MEKNKAEPWSHSAGMCPHRALIHTRLNVNNNTPERGPDRLASAALHMYSFVNVCVREQKRWKTFLGKRGSVRVNLGPH